MSDALFAGYEPPATEHLSADRRRTQRQHADVERGVHPLMRTPLHPDAPTDVKPTDGRRPVTCGTCTHRSLEVPHFQGWPKCGVGPVSRSAATDVRAWWPACPQFEGAPS